MECRWIKTAAVAFGFLASWQSKAQFASAVSAYTPGASVGAFNNPANALGQPSVFNNDPDFPSAVDQFNSPYLTSQIVSVGIGGSLTLQMSTPVRNDPTHPFGTDFIVYGNAFFIYSDFPAGKTDGTVFGASAGATRVSVSVDGVQFYNLDMTLAPVVDGYFPTDGAGTFGRAVDPALANAAAFNGATLDQIRALYNGSAGGTDFDLAWARDGSGAPVSLSEINFVRIESLTEKVEVDGVAAVPEPSTWALLGAGGVALLARKRRA